MDEDETTDWIAEILDFYRRMETQHTANVEDFKRSKNFASGNGFKDVDTNRWKRNRAHVNLNLVEPAVNAICLQYASDPFAFKGAEGIDNGVVQELLRESIEDGIGYALVEFGDGRPTIRKLDNLNTLMDGEAPDGSDSECALVVSKMSESELRRQYGREFERGDSRLSGLANAICVAPHERLVCTFYRRTAKGVAVAQTVGGEIAAEGTMPLSRLPMVRFFGKRAWIDEKTNWRGVYYSCRDVLQTLMFLVSLMQERIATAPTVRFRIPEEALGDNTEQWADINGGPKAFASYRSVIGDGQNAVQLRPPEPIDQEAHITDLSAAFQMLKSVLDASIGSDASASAKSHETAESVLLKREEKESAGNIYLRNLLTSCKAVARIAGEMLENPDGVVVEENIFAKAKKASDMAKLSALSQIYKESPALLPAYIMNADLDEKLVQVLINGVEQANQTQQLAQAAQASDQQVQQLTQQLQATQAQASQTAQALQQARQAFFEMENDSRAKIAVARLHEEGEIRQEMIRAEVKLVELGQKDKVDMAKLQNDSIETLAKIAKEAETALPTQPDYPF
jgi:hypothetical protein